MIHVLVHMDAPTESLKEYDSQRAALSGMREANRNAGYTPVSTHVIGDYISEWSFHEDASGSKNHTYAPYRVILKEDLKNSANKVSVQKEEVGRYFMAV